MTKRSYDVKEEIRRTDQKKNGYITTQDVIYEGIHREYLTMLVEEEKLIRTSPGVYQSKDAWEDKLTRINKKRNI